LNPGYDKYCALLDPEECTESLYCTPFENECIPIYVKDYTQINKDPDSYIDKMGTEELKRLRDVAAHLYYNVGDSGIADNSFDAIEWHLRKRLKKEYDKEVKLGAIPISKLRVDLPYPMASLNKLYPEDRSFHTFVKDTPVKGLIWSDKLDGVSCLAVYNNGKVIGLYTRIFK
jgi:NAD-dependent DNA ligase